MTDDLLDSKSVLHQIESHLEGRVELGKAKWREEQEHREVLKNLRKRKVDLRENGKGQKKNKVEDTKEVEVEEDETESESYESEEEKEILPMSSRKKEAFIRANERSLTEVGRKRQENNQEYQRKKVDLRVRAAPIGQDMMENTYWVFQSDRKRLYVYGPGMRGMKKQNKWRYYETKAQVDKVSIDCLLYAVNSLQLIASLDKYLPGEKSLLGKLELFYDRITKTFPKDQADKDKKKAKLELVEEEGEEEEEEGEFVLYIRF